MTDEEIADLVDLGERIAERAIDVGPFGLCIQTSLAFESFNLGLMAACTMLGQYIGSLNDDEVQNEERLDN